MTRILFSVVAILTTANIATASPFFWERSNPETWTTPTNCADFTGEYRGACNSSAQGTYNNNFKIQQNGCELIKIKGMDFHIAGLLSASVTMPALKGKPALVKSGSVGLQWNKNRQALLMTAVGVKQAIGGAEVMKVKQANGEMKLDGNKLNLLLTDANGKSIASCSFIKQ